MEFQQDRVRRRCLKNEVAILADRIAGPDLEHFEIGASAGEELFDVTGDAAVCDDELGLVGHAGIYLGAITREIGGLGGRNPPLAFLERKTRLGQPGFVFSWSVQGRFNGCDCRRVPDLSENLSEPNDVVAEIK